MNTKITLRTLRTWHIHFKLDFSFNKKIIFFHTFIQSLTLNHLKVNEKS